MSVRHPKVGDVISSRAFVQANAKYESAKVPCEYAGLKRANKRAFGLDYKSLSVGRGNGIRGYQVITGIDQDGDEVEVQKGDYTANTNAPDKSRGEAKFVVERTAFTGGGTGHGPHDIYPDGHLSVVRRLRDDDTYDPDGEAIEFYTSGSFTNQIEPDQVIYHDALRMARTFVRKEKTHE